MSAISLSALMPARSLSAQKAYYIAVCPNACNIAVCPKCLLSLSADLSARSLSVLNACSISAHPECLLHLTLPQCLLYLCLPKCLLYRCLPRKPAPSLSVQNACSIARFTVRTISQPHVIPVLSQKFRFFVESVTGPQMSTYPYILP